MTQIFVDPVDLCGAAPTTLAFSHTARPPPHKHTTAQRGSPWLGGSGPATSGEFGRKPRGVAASGEVL